MLPRPKNLSAWAEKQLLRLEAGEFVDAGTLVNTLATTLAGLAPFILHLEDAHEASPERMALLQKLGQVVPRNRGVGLIVSSRSPLPEPFQTFRLEVLSQAESGALLISEMGTALPSQALDYIYARAQGNPLFTLEFLRYLTRQGFLWSDGHHWQWRPPPEGFVPVSLEAIISHLISSANTPELKTILQARTMLPVNLETDSVVATWAQVAGLSLEAFVQPYEFLEQQGIFVRHDFAHPLIGELVKREITSAERQATAQRAFGVFASRLELAVLYVQEAAVDKPQAFELIQQLIATARAQNDKRQETELLSVACAYCPAEQVLEFNLEAARLMLSLNAGQAIVHAEAAVQHAPDNHKALMLAAETWAYERRKDRVEFYLAQIPERQKANQDWFEYLTRVWTLLGNYNEVVNLWNHQPDFQAGVEALTVTRVATALANLGQFKKAEQLLHSALTREDLRAITRANLLSLLGFVQGALGNYSLALDCYAQGYQLLLEAGSTINIASSLLNQSSILAVFGRFEQAIHDLYQALALFGDQGLKIPYAVVQSRLGEYLTELGQFEKAEKHLLEGLQELGQISVSPYLIDCQYLLCDLYRHWNPPYARSLVQRFSSHAFKNAQLIGSDKVMTEALTNASVTESWLGNPKHGLELAEQALKIAQTLASPARVHGALRAQVIGHGKLGNLELARVLFGELPNQHEERFVLETQKVGLLLDVLTNDLAAAKERTKWFDQKGFFGAVALAEQYFPELKQMPTVPATNLKPTFSLRVLGTIELEQNLQVVLSRGRKRLEFLVYLLETRISGRTEAPTLEIIDALYPELLEPEAKSALKQLVYLLRNKLGSDLILSTPQGYALGTVTSDAEQFLETGDASLWRGVYLENLTEGWLPGVRDALVQALQQKVDRLAKTDAKQTARIGQILLEMEPYDRDTLELILRAIGEADPLTGSVYRQAKTRFEQIGETLPSSSEAFLRSRDVSISAD